MKLYKILFIALFVIFVGCKIENKAIKETSDLIPEWVKITYEYSKDSGEFQTVHFFKQVNDTVSYCVYTKTEGFSCETSFVSTLIDKKELTKQKISNKCDINYEEIVNKYSTHSMLKSNIIKTVSYTESIPDSMLTSTKRIKKGISLIDIKRELDSTVRFVKISSKGKLVKK
ncbi:hypothetical protein SAMN05444411_1087 [Lutibacter oricola]|uniref:Lipoprotein n=1 Tax=Lutibacter oricola TaxID=762486 RepID=A0A1H3DM08_9FLAO|nr:hypothetical protein [Lutibacter oricola]SDX67397.1 hypothetical protein SAMN05444411_1087 [Lutibacter oricola]